MPDSLDTTRCGVDAMCQDSTKAESEKVCVNMCAHEHASVPSVIYLNTCFLFVYMLYI